MAHRPIYINGRFLGKSITGCERFATEIVWALDAFVAEKDFNSEIKILAPKGTPIPQGLSRIGFETIGVLQGHLWEQFELLFAAKRGILFSPANSGPVLHPRQLTVIHDASVFRLPKNFSFAYRTLHKFLGRALALRSKIATVSEFSRQELCEILGLRESDVQVFSNGHEHILRHTPEPKVLTKLGLSNRPYFLFVGSPVPNKNLERAVGAFKSLKRSDCAFVLVGGVPPSSIFSNRFEQNSENVILPGRLSDGEIVALYQGATSLIFPSLYEGFGIPPLEAMALGCPVAASEIPPVKEVCGDAALYFDPVDVNSITAVMKKIIDAPELTKPLVLEGLKRAPMFSWRKSATKLFDLLNK